MKSDHSDLVADTKIRAEFHADLTHRFTIQSRVCAGQNVRRKETEDVWKREKLLGKGSYGTVWLHRCLSSHDQTPPLQAVKVVTKALMAHDKINYHKELEIIAKFSQKIYAGLFVDYLGWYEDHESIFIAMEYLENGDLDDNLKQPIPECEAREITLQITEGLEFLHSNGFVHRDLKPANIFVVSKGPEWWVKIGDFGISKRVKPGGTSLRTVVGTPLFVAPEVLGIYPPDTAEISDNRHYTEKVDMWSLGVMVFYMLFHEYPFPFNNQSVLMRYVQGSPFPFPSDPSKNASETCYDFMKLTMAANASKRPSAQESRQTEWLVQHRPLESVSETNAPAVQRNVLDSAHIVSENMQDTTVDTYESFKSWNTGKTDMTGPGSEEHLPEVQRATPEPQTVVIAPNHSQIKADAGFEENYLQELEAIHQKGLAFFQQGDYEKALLQFNDVARLREEVLGQSDRETLASRYMQGKCLHALKQYDNAQITLREVAAGQKLAEADRPEDLDETLNSIHQKGRDLYQNKEYSEAKVKFHQAAARRKRAFGENDSKTLISQHWLGRSLFNLRQYPEARNTLRRVLDKQRETLAPQDPAILSSLDWLGHTFYSLGEYQQALDILQELFDIKRKDPGIEEIRRISAFKKLGNSLFSLGMFQESQDIFNELLQIQNSDSNPNAGEVQYAQHRLGRCSYSLSRYQAARDAFKLASEGRRTVFGSNDPQTLDSLYWLGCSCYELKQYKDARKYLGEASAGQEKTLGFNHRDTLYSLYWLGKALYDSKETETARDTFQRTTEGMKTQLGSRHNQTLRCLFWTGCAYSTLDEYDKAEKYFRDTFDGQKEAFGLDDCDTLTTLHRLGLVLYHADKDHEALDTFEMAAQGRKSLLGAKHKDTLISIYYFGCACYALRQWERSREYFQEAVDGQREVLGPNNRDTLTSLHWLGRAYSRCENHQEAAEVFQQTADAQRDTLGPTHRHTLESVYRLGLSLYDMKEYRRAQSAFRQALKGNRETLGPSGDFTLKTMHWFGHVLHVRGKQRDAALIQKELISLIKQKDKTESSDTLEVINDFAQTPGRQWPPRTSSGIDTSKSES
ncbi:uncharacterized protein N7459_006260 [Penicillium hispanicum]|uniref:uncharacterized protein n=1 Tax=Penicillium hispanicum TaxID=1080232 RepID=UPI002541BC61|nr:uncharacterized protein N7459_006260 [Penicillium hispanicum]KAJ5580275.1 hypothetical protein N7459_006260 [Penicillium hispanicum]